MKKSTLGRLLLVFVVFTTLHTQEKSDLQKNADDSAKTFLQTTRKEFLKRIRFASQKACDNGFEKFIRGYEVVQPDRQQILKSLDQYNGKIIANAKFRKVKWHQKGWFLKHNKEIFSYVWDPALWERFRAIELEHFKMFRGIRKKIAKYYNVPEDSLSDWKHPGLWSIEFVAVVDGKTSFRQEVEVCDAKGRVVGKGKSKAISVVNLRIVGLKSRYFTVWLGGTDTNKNLDISDLPFSKKIEFPIEKSSSVDSHTGSPIQVRFFCKNIQDAK
ncbi:hypothetical protein [Candidatus Uabimicrobium sp. HlEnr_7]|uniref:hypothetical protein n=1 Tax=Candidatus Uabimicrobium helgolandensis TaxID=3095367 RepID=UPI0035581FD8